MSIFQILRSSTFNARPTGKLVGEPYVNFAEGQFGVHNGTTHIDLLPVRYWNSMSSYVTGDHVFSGGYLYRCLTPHINAVPPNANWAMAGGSVTTVAGRAGDVVLVGNDITDLPTHLLPYAMLASPIFTGTPQGPTHPTTDNSQNFATTAFVHSLVSSGVAGVSTFNGRTGDILLTAADVTNVHIPASVAPPMAGVGAPGIGTNWARADHVHPSDTSRLPVAGGNMTGALVTMPPVNPGEAANKNYVDTMVGSLRLFRGVYEVANNVPDLTTTVGHNSGDFYMAVTAVPTVPEGAHPGVPGIGGTDIGNGDVIIYNGSIFQHVVGSGMTVPQADSRYMNLTGDTMTGPLILDNDPTHPLGAVTKQYIDNGTFDAGTF